MKTENVEPSDVTELCECGHRASQHDEGEDSCEAAGCECEAMEPVPPDSDDVQDDNADEPRFWAHWAQPSGRTQRTASA
jgi:hypothetical protein